MIDDVFQESYYFCSVAVFIQTMKGRNHPARDLFLCEKVSLPDFEVSFFVVVPFDPKCLYPIGIYD